MKKKDLQSIDGMLKKHLQSLISKYPDTEFATGCNDSKLDLIDEILAC